ncbi:hypothetical protein M9H77_31871 [Catharanthus roseus]|uniref:Uncharacterized protein n=1 Tax=Catharanthus roseus TaxID=4058 RepID=A0ACC0A1N5_CATRO|nr:hypothetical protein M9H77_31871 [Catharanthus roseus]
MQEPRQEWDQKIAYRSHVLSEWAARHFADLGYRLEYIHLLISSRPVWVDATVSQVDMAARMMQRRTAISLPSYLDSFMLYLIILVLVFMFVLFFMSIIYYVLLM